MRNLIIFLIIALLHTHAKAVIAYPQIINYHLDNGDSVRLIIKGDEHCKWAITEDGYTLLPDTLGWLYAEKDTDGYASVSSYRLCAQNKRSDELTFFLKNVPLRLPIRRNGLQGKLIKRNTIPSEPFSIPKTGNRKALVILMAFKDLAYQKSYQDINALFNQENYDMDGAKGSVRDYYSSVSYGQLNITCNILGPYTAKYNMNYYGENAAGGNDKNPKALFEEAIQQASKQINLTDYDGDRDGYVDNIHIIFAGYGEEAGASSTAIWSHESTFSEPDTTNGIKMNGYSCAPELRGNSGTGLSRIGVHCHEIGHSLGTMDFYDTDYSTGGEYSGTGQWDIMASGSWNNNGISPADFNPYVKAYNFGWVDIQTLSAGNNIILSTNENKNQIYRLDTQITGEYYLLENRTQTGFNESIPGSGLLIYHIHKDILSVGNKINATYPQKCYIVCASATTSIPTATSSSFGSVNSAGCPFPGTSIKTTFNNSSIPAAFCWDGTTCQISLSNINRNTDGSISLNNIIQYNNDSVSDIVFKENFENINLTTNQIQGNVSWKVFNSSSGQLYDDFTPAPIEGKCYLYLKQTSVLFSQTKNTSRVKLYNISLEPNSSYTLQFQYQNKGNVNNPPSLNILYRTPIMSDWQTLISYADLTSTWIDKKVTIINPSEQYELAFQGSLNFGGLYIDDVKVRKSTQTALLYQNDLTNKMYVQNGNLNIYSNKPLAIKWLNVAGSLQGKSLLSVGLNKISFPQKGIYLIILENIVYKVVIY